MSYLMRFIIENIFFSRGQALDLKKLQTPLFQEFINSLNNNNETCAGKKSEENMTKNLKFPPKIKTSPNKNISGKTVPLVGTANRVSPENCSRRVSNSGEENDQVLREISPKFNERGGLLQDAQQEPNCPRFDKDTSVENYLICAAFC